MPVGRPPAGRRVQDSPRRMGRLSPRRAGRLLGRSGGWCRTRPGGRGACRPGGRGACGAERRGAQLLRRRRLGRVGRRIRVRVRRILLSDLNHPTDLHDLQCDCIDQPTHKFQLLFFLNISPVNRNRVKISRQQKNGRHSERNAKEKRKKKTHLLGGFSRLSETRAHGVDQDGDAVVLDRNWTSN